MPQQAQPRVLLAAPTGYGKTVIASAIVGSAVAGGRRVQGLAHPREIIEHSSVVALVDPIAAFAARCEARALLFAAGEYSLHEAVDVLQEYAEQSRLVDALGTDAVQQLMNQAFEVVRR